MAHENELQADSIASGENQSQGVSPAATPDEPQASDAAPTRAQPEDAAAMTGHQVWTSIHANSSESALGDED